jgi:hypothetical protein
MKHYATREFWAHYRRLPAEIQQLADKNFALLKQDLHHPSLRLKKVGVYWSARVGLHHRVLGAGKGAGKGVRTIFKTAPV